MIHWPDRIFSIRLGQMAVNPLGFTIRGTAGNDRLTGTYAGAEWFIADAGDDTYDGASPNIGGPTGQDRSAYDSVSYEFSPSGVNVNLQTGIAKDGWGGTDRLINIAYIFGSMYNDTLVGDEYKNWISGLAGDDYIDGGPDSDFGYIAYYADDPAGVRVDLTLGQATDGWGGRDTIVNMRSIIGSRFDDTLIGNASPVNEISGGAGADFIDGGPGIKDTIRYWDSGRLLIGSNSSLAGDRKGVFVDLSNGFAFDEWGTRDSFVNIEGVDVGSGNDTIIGDGKNNDFIVRGGADMIDGGGGLDRVIYARHEGGASAASHAVARQSDGSFLVTGKGGTEQVTNVERLVFTDAVVALDISGAAGQAYRLYQAAFDRTPDKGGLTYWVSRMDQGVSLGDVASGFLSSAEARSVYGANSSNSAFVELLYQHVLHRPGEPAGVAFWAGQLESGARTRSAILIGFSESTENVALVGAAIQNGISLDVLA